MKIPNPSSYIAPTRIFVGINAHKKLNDILGEWQIRELLILSDASVAETEFFTQVKAILKEAGAKYEIFTQVESEPSDKTVQKAFAVFEAINAPVILAGFGRFGNYVQAKEKRTKSLPRS